MDLVALNVQRGQDHGLAPYVKWRQLCGLQSVKSWKQFASIVSSPEVTNLLNYISKISSKFIKFMIHIVVETVLPIVKISITASSKITAIIWTCRGTRSVHRWTVRKKRW